MERNLGRLTSDQFARLVPRKTDRVLLPVGTVEAHGVIPLGTDIIIPEGLCAKLADRLGALIAPTVNYGITRSLRAYPGSLTVTPATFEAYVREVLVSLAEAGFRTAVIMNGHGGHNDELKRVGTDVYARTKLKTVVVHWWLFTAALTREIYGRPGGHAFLDETGMVIALAPELVDRRAYRGEHYTGRDGIVPHPWPARIGIYEPTRPELDFDLRKARRLLAASVKAIGDELETILAGWRRFKL